MNAALYLLFALIVLAFALLRLSRNRQRKNTTARVQAEAGKAQNPDETAENRSGDDCDGACGSCISECRIEQLLAPPVYFEDEELDAFAGRAADGYTADETAVFEEVLTTLQPAEVSEWLTSLEQRGVALPNDLRDMALMLVRESRSASAQ